MLFPWPLCEICYDTLVSLCDTLPWSLLPSMSDINRFSWTWHWCNPVQRQLDCIISPPPSSVFNRNHLIDLYSWMSISTTKSSPLSACYQHWDKLEQCRIQRGQDRNKLTWQMAQNEATKLLWLTLSNLQGTALGLLQSNVPIKWSRTLQAWAIQYIKWIRYIQYIVSNIWFNISHYTRRALV